MSQQTRVFELAAAQAAGLEASLRSLLPADAEWRRVPHARFSVKAQGVVMTCYRSGKVVLQGSDTDGFAARFLGGITPRTARRPDEEMPLDRPTVASDEAGKGDYFGPLVVAAVYAEPADVEAFERLGVADSKTLSDTRALMLAGRISDQLEHEVLSVDPVSYNARYAEAGNLNTLLAQLHAEVLAPLIGRHAGAAVLVDKFAAPQVLEQALRNHLSDMPAITQVPRAEANLAVAAASILARASFLEGLKRCEESCGTDLHKGAGQPVDRAARRVVDIGGDELLATVAKLHFKNTLKIGGRKP